MLLLIGYINTNGYTPKWDSYPDRVFATIYQDSKSGKIQIAVSGGYKRYPNLDTAIAATLLGKQV